MNCIWFFFLLDYQHIKAQYLSHDGSSSRKSSHLCSAYRELGIVSDTLHVLIFLIQAVIALL